MDKPWSATTRTIVGLLLFVFSLVLIYISRSVLPMMIIAALIAFLVRPLIVHMIERWRFPRTAAVVVAYLLVALVIILAPLILVPPAIDTVNFFLELDYPELVRGALEYVESNLLAIKNNGFRILGYRLVLDNLVDPLLDGLADPDSLPAPELPSMSTVIGSIGQAFSFSYGFAIDLVGTLFSTIISFVFLIIASIYISMDGNKLLRYITERTPEDLRSDFETIMERLRVIWNSFFRGQITLMLSVGIVTWIGATAIGLPGAIYLAIIAGVMEVIPNLGPTIAAIPAVLVALLQGSMWIPVNNLIFALIVIGLYVLINFLENTFFVPRVMSGSVKLHPLVVIIGVLVGASVWGILGALLAAPVIASGREIIRYLYYRTIGENPFPADKDLEADQQTVSFKESFEELKEKAQLMISREEESEGKQSETTNEEPDSGDP
jgi:predicted PurR-regulated permease PerM